MRGRQGLLLVVFVVLVWLARWFDVGALRQIDLLWFQVINLLFCFGLAICIVALLARYWAAVNRPE